MKSGIFVITINTNSRTFLELEIPIFTQNKLKQHTNPLIVSFGNSHLTDIYHLTNDSKLSRKTFP